MNKDYAESSLIEQPAVALFRELGWEIENYVHEKFGANSMLGRKTANGILLSHPLRVVFARLNPDLPSAAIGLAIEELTSDLLMFKLISDEIDVSELDVEIGV